MGDVRLPETARKDPTKPRACTPLKVETVQSRKAATIVNLVFRELQFDYRELSHALTILKPQAVCEKGKPATDGEHYFYDPAWVIEHVREEGYSSGYLRASVLHIVIHGLLGHFAEHVKYRRRNWIWDVMDLQVHELLKEIRDAADRETT